MLTPDPQQQRAIEHRELSQTIAKTETQIAALRRFAALPPETVAAVKDEASALREFLCSAGQSRPLLLSSTVSNEWSRRVMGRVRP